MKRVAIDPRELNQNFINRRFHSNSMCESPFRYVKVESSRLMVSKPTKGMVQGVVVKDLGADLLISLCLTESQPEENPTQIVMTKYEFLTNNRL